MVNSFLRFPVIWPLFTNCSRSKSSGLGTQLSSKLLRRSSLHCRQIVSLCTMTQCEEQVLACNSSPYGVGALLSLKMGNGLEKPIALHFLLPGSCRTKYSHLNRKDRPLSLVLKHFISIFFYHHFINLCDHKSL